MTNPSSVYERQFPEMHDFFIFPAAVFKFIIPYPRLPRNRFRAFDVKKPLPEEQLFAIY